MSEKKKFPHIFAVVPTFNRLSFTKKCLASFARQKYQNITVVLVDSGSTDGTREYFKKKYKSWVLIEGNSDWWWTRSTYEGVAFALKKAKRGDFVLEMNNDCYFGEGYVEQLLATARDHPNAIIGSICVRHDRPTEVVEAGIRIHWPTGLVYSVAQKISNKLSYYKNMKVVGDLDALPGKGTLVPVKVFRKIGNFNYKKLPHYIADYEFTGRAKRAGFDLLVDTKAIVKHYWEATGISSTNSAEKNNLNQAWRLLFARKSMNNIIDWINFILIACPKEYRAGNFYITFIKIAKAIFSVPPFYYLRPYVRYLLYNSLNIYSDLKLKIIQFPEVHLKKKR